MSSSKKHDKMAKKALQLGNAITAGVKPCSNEKTPRTVKRYYAMVTKLRPSSTGLATPSSFTTR